MTENATAPEMPEIVTNVESRGGWEVVVVDGDLDVVTGGPLGAMLVSLIETGASVAMDCSGIGLVDSTGLRSIVRANNAARQHSGSFVLISVPTLLERLLNITKLSDVVKVAGSIAEIDE